MTRERLDAEPECECGHLVCHHPPCDGRLYHDQALHDFLAHGDGDALGDLVAGRIDQAEYRRRMADLERRAADSLDAQPAPARRSPEPARSGMVIAYLAAVAIALFAFAVVAIVALAAPRTTHQPTAPTPASDVAGLALASTVPAPSSSAAGSSGAPHGMLGTRAAPPRPQS